MFQQITVMGRLAKDMEVKQTQAGKPVGVFSIPCTEKWDGGEHTEWFNCAMFGDRAQKVSQYMIKGKAVMITGTLQTREHNGKRFTNLKVDKLQFAGDARNMQQQQSQNQGQGHYTDTNLDDVPF